MSARKEKTTQPVNKATKLGGKAAQPVAKATKPVTKATKPEAKPTKPEAKPTKPVTKPTKPEAKATKPVAKPTKPVAKPTKPVAKPTKATKVTKPATKTTKATKPATKATKAKKANKVVAKPVQPVAKAAKPVTKAANTVNKAEEDDVRMLLSCNAHVGSVNITTHMTPYVFGRNEEGVHIFNPKFTLEKIRLAARVICGIENPADVCVVSGRSYGQRAVLKFAKYTGCTALATRFTPGTFTNQIQKKYIEPRLLIVTDPITDHQPIMESSYMNMPVIALCDSDAPLRFIDIAIPSNNKGIKQIGIIYWMLAREVLRIRGQLPYTKEWDVMPDLFFFREPEERKKKEEEEIVETEPEETSIPQGFHSRRVESTPEEEIRHQEKIEKAAAKTIPTIAPVSETTNWADVAADAPAAGAGAWGGPSWT